MNNYEYFSRLASKINLKKDKMIFPLIVYENGTFKESILVTTNLNKIDEVLENLLKVGLKNIIIFGIPKTRDEDGKESWNPNGIVQRAVRNIKDTYGDKFNVITDTCVCQYNFSGHCGLSQNNVINNDKSLQIISKIASSQAEAGADIIAPSSMMDGQVKSIKAELKNNGFTRVKIMSFSTKIASSLYSTFRSTTYKQCSNLNIDKSSYQLSFFNQKESLREVELDIMEGADIIVVKPSLCYLDLIYRIKEKFRIPIAIQHVSGEYSMLRAASTKGLLDENEWFLSFMSSLIGAGADFVISYNALNISKYLS